MRGHLAAGCDRCQPEAAFCIQLTEVCRRLEGQQVPEWVLRLAKAIFPYRAPDRPKRGTRLPIEIIYDSFLVPVPAGLRATWQIGWQGLYRAGDCSLDVRIEPEMKSAGAALVGQIANHVLPDAEMANVQVRLVAGKSVVAETRSNRFGEFQMEYQQGSQLKLCIYLQDGSKTIQVPLRRLTNEGPVGFGRAIKATTTTGK